MYGDDFRLDDVDELFNELDKLVDFAKESIKRKGDVHAKYDASVAMINLIMEEVPPEDIKIYQQDGGSWIAEVKYKGIVFIAIAVKHKPQFWDEVFNIK